MAGAAMVLATETAQGRHLAPRSRTRIMAATAAIMDGRPSPAAHWATPQHLLSATPRRNAASPKCEAVVQQRNGATYTWQLQGQGSPRGEPGQAGPASAPARASVLRSAYARLPLHGAR